MGLELKAGCFSNTGQTTLSVFLDLEARELQPQLVGIPMRNVVSKCLSYDRYQNGEHDMLKGECGSLRVVVICYSSNDTTTHTVEDLVSEA